MTQPAGAQHPLDVVEREEVVETPRLCPGYVQRLSLEDPVEELVVPGGLDAAR